jgi:hypothetical protein
MVIKYVGFTPLFPKPPDARVLRFQIGLSNIIRISYFDIIVTRNTSPNFRNRLNRFF